MDFYNCDRCNKIIEVVDDGVGALLCCNEKMTQLVPNTVDAAQEKHIPVGTIQGNQLHVAVGSVVHPMTEEHHIGWIAIEQGQKVQRQHLSKTGKPEAVFTIENGPVTIYAYCNLHGLWVATLS